jgi:hypothetical protein
MIEMIARLSLVALALTIAGLAGVHPAAAQSGIARLTVYGNDPCPRSQGDEIVVCARQPESERYRVPKVLRDAAKNGVQSWGERAESLEYVGASGTASCSPAGAGGWTGCQSKLLSQARAERKQRKSEEAEVP